MDAEKEATNNPGAMRLAFSAEDASVRIVALPFDTILHIEN